MNFKKNKNIFNKSLSTLFFCTFAARNVFLETGVFLFFYFLFFGF